MAQDVQHVLRQYDDAPDREPMHGKPGEIRHSLSTDERRVKRQLQRSKTADLEDPVVTQSHTATIADLLGQAERAETHAQRQAFVLQAEQLRTAQLAEQDAGSFDPKAAVIRDVLVPGRVHERTTADSDWLLGLATTASLDTASQNMLAEATLWFGRVSDEVKAYKGEFEEQARNKAHHVASAYGDVAEQAERVFLDESARLHSLSVKAGQIKLAADEDSDEDDDGDDGGFAYSGSHAASTDPDAPRVSTAAALQRLAEGNPIEDLKSGSDTEGLDQASDAVRQQYTSASGLSQVGEEGGVPQETFTSLQGQGAEPNTSSNRAPALQELNQTSPVVPVNDPGLGQVDDRGVNAANGVSGQRDAAQPAGGFPVSGSLNKESSMEHAQCPTCGGQGKVAVRTLDPREAYSNLPQIDEIIGNDDHPGTAPAPGQSEAYPSQVAFPWNMNPGNIPATISEAEQQIANRPQGRPGAPGGGGGVGGSVTAQQHKANGRDNSGWMGDMGAKGLDYPGYSTPVYDGSTNLGQPDPVYGEGGDNPNAPKRPNGHQEANDYTNDPGMNWQPGQPTQYDQGAAEAGPTMNTSSAFHPDPAIAQAQAAILQAQAVIAHRNAQLQGQG